MNGHLDRAGSLVRSVIDEVRAENVTFMAGSIAYQAFVSLIPLLALVFLAVAMVGDQALAEQVLALTESMLPGTVQELLRGYIVGDAAAGTAGAGAIGVITLLWGSLKIFRGLDTAFSAIYDTEGENSLVDQLIDGLVVFLTLGGAIVAAGVATTAFAAFPEIPYIGVLAPLALIAGLAVAFFPIYYRFPDTNLSVREIVPGVVVAAVGWAALQALFQVYLAYTSRGATSAQDVIGAILLLLTWLYLGGLVLLIGGVVNAVIAGRAGDSAPDATPGWKEGAGGAAAGAPADDRDAEALRAERQRLQRERSRVRDLRYELESERRAVERERRVQEMDTEKLLRENGYLRRLVRWHERPVWERLLLRSLGLAPKRQR